MTKPDLDAPLRLKDALEHAFPNGGMKLSGLRNEIRKGRLVAERIAGKHFVTLRAINEMREQCRETDRALDCGLNPRREIRKESSSGARHGSFETDRVKSALAALETTVKGLSAPSLNTSPRNTQSPETGDVIRLKSSC
jgi:hypothetical protein